MELLQRCFFPVFLVASPFSGGSCWDIWLLAFVLSGCTWSYGVSGGGKLLVSIDNESHFGEIQREVQLSRGGRHSFTSGEAIPLTCSKNVSEDVTAPHERKSTRPPRRLNSILGAENTKNSDDILRKNRFNGPSSGHQERQAIEELYAPYHLPSLCRPIGEC